MMKAGCNGRRRTWLPVYMVPSMLLCGQQKNLTYLRRAIDLARIARDPRRAHRLLGDAVEMLRADPHILQAARHAELPDERVQHIAGVLAGMAHRRRHQRLAFGVSGLVP